MISWALAEWSQVHPNLIASAISTAAGMAWQHRRFSRLLAKHHAEMQKSPAEAGLPAD